MKNMNCNDKLKYWHQSVYKVGWTLGEVLDEAINAGAPPNAKFYTHTDKDVSPFETQIIFDWSTT